MTDETNNPQTQGDGAQGATAAGEAAAATSSKLEVTEIREREDLGKGHRAAILSDGTRLFLSNEGKDKDVKVGDFVDPRDFRRA